MDFLRKVGKAISGFFTSAGKSLKSKFTSGKKSLSNLFASLKLRFFGTPGIPKVSTEMMSPEFGTGILPKSDDIPFSDISELP